MFHQETTLSRFIFDVFGLKQSCYHLNYKQLCIFQCYNILSLLSQKLAIILSRNTSPLIHNFVFNLVCNFIFIRRNFLPVLL